MFYAKCKKKCNCTSLRIHGYTHLQVDANKVVPQGEMKIEERKSNPMSLDSKSIEPEDFNLIEEEAMDIASTQTSGIFDGLEVSSDVLLND